MSSPAKCHQYPIRVEPSDKSALEKASRQTGQSINQLVVLCVRQALPGIRAALSRESGRVTNVDPLPAAVSKRLYSEPDDDEDSIRLFMTAQAKSVEE